MGGPSSVGGPSSGGSTENALRNAVTRVDRLEDGLEIADFTRELLWKLGWVFEGGSAGQESVVPWRVCDRPPAAGARVQTAVHRQSSEELQPGCPN
eukprot:COSAG02_NODE_16006_length_1123_cov_2.426614_2_plen_96_part_00